MGSAGGCFEACEEGYIGGASSAISQLHWDSDVRTASLTPTRNLDQPGRTLPMPNYMACMVCP
jgi:hypothetical protein